MAVASITFTNEELEAVLRLATTDEVDFDFADVPTATVEALAQSYLNLILAKNTTFEPFGRQLRRFANGKVDEVRESVPTEPNDPEAPENPGDPEDTEPTENP